MKFKKCKGDEMSRTLTAIILICVWMISAWTHEMDIKNQLLRENRTHFLFTSDIRVDNTRVIEYIEKESK